MRNHAQHIYKKTCNGAYRFHIAHAICLYAFSFFFICFWYGPVYFTDLYWFYWCYFVFIVFNYLNRCALNVHDFCCLSIFIYVYWCLIVFSCNCCLLFYCLLIDVYCFAIDFYWFLLIYIVFYCFCWLLLFVLLCIVVFLVVARCFCYWFSSTVIDYVLLPSVVDCVLSFIVYWFSLISKMFYLYFPSWLKPWSPVADGPLLCSPVTKVTPQWKINSKLF